MQTLYIISHTHWDREWYKTFQQFRLQLVHLVENLLTILDNDPTYLHFMLDGQTIVLEDYLQVRAENLARLQKYIQEKRVLIGGLQHAAHTLLIVFHGAGKAINAIAVHPGGNTALLGAGIALQVAVQHGYRVAGADLRAQLHMAVQLRCKG